MTPCRFLPLVTRVFALCCLASVPVRALAAGVEVTPLADRVEVKVDGEPFTTLRFKDGPKPYFYPLLAPGGTPVTRHFPMRKDAADEEQDHPHHRSLWFTHGDVNGVDFWAEGPERGRIVQEKLIEAKGGAEEGVIRTANHWVTAAGKGVLTDEMTFRVIRQPGGRLLEYAITLKASEGTDVTFGDTKEGTFGLRLAESMRLKQNKHYAGKTPGHILQDTGVRDGETWGKRAKWTAYTGPIGDHNFSVTVFDHPSNPRYPTWWHVRDYGLFAANPFGLHDFEKKEKGAGNLVLKAGEQLTFRYRVLIQAGEADPAKLGELAAAFGR